MKGLPRMKTGKLVSLGFSGLLAAGTQQSWSHGLVPEGEVAGRVEGLASKRRARGGARPCNGRGIFRRSCSFPGDSCWLLSHLLINPLICVCVTHLFPFSNTQLPQPGQLGTLVFSSLGALLPWCPEGSAATCSVPYLNPCAESRC